MNVVNKSGVNKTWWLICESMRSLCVLFFTVEELAIVKMIFLSLGRHLLCHTWTYRF